MERLAIRLGLLGSALGMVAGIIEMSIGKQILPWIGNKGNPVALGIVTLLLSGVAMAAILAARRGRTPTNDGKLAIVLGVLLPAAICFTTVGRLWYVPGLLLLSTTGLLAYAYWGAPPPKDTAIPSAGLLGRGRLLGALGGMLVLVSIALALSTSNFELYRSEARLETGLFRVEILPMDFVRLTSSSAAVPALKEIEVGRVMIVYLLLILGSALAVLASLAASRVFLQIGGVLMLAGLALFLALLPGILQQAQLPSEDLLQRVSSLGQGWFLAAAGAALSVIGARFRLR